MIERTTGGFTSRSVRTTVAEAHGAPFPDEVRRAVWFVEPTDAAVVLGSAQRLSTLELGEVARRGLGVVRRRSGGGAVVIEPDSSSWFDVWLPADDPLFERDVSSSGRWLGEMVVKALDLLGVEGQRVEPDDIVRSSERSRWASLVCFAASSAGEVRVEGRKAVGVSQRRTRAGARFQVVILHRFDPDATAALCALAGPERQSLAEHLRRTVTGVTLERSALREAIERVLATI